MEKATLVTLGIMVVLEKLVAQSLLPVIAFSVSAEDWVPFFVAKQNVHYKTGLLTFNTISHASKGM